MRHLILFTLLLCLCSSCFEIKEKVAMNKDGSGKLVLTLDISESAPTLKTYLETAKMTGQNVPTTDNINAMLSAIEKHFENGEGMSNVETVRDFDNYVFAVKGDFTNIKALNTVMAQVTQSFTRGALAGTMDNFIPDGNTLSRLFPYPLDKIKYDQMGMMYQYMLESARYTNEYEFAEPVQAMSNEKASLDETKTQVSMQQSLASIIKGTGSLENDIDF
ncbi:MAG: hypothetical protein AB8G22_10410 [Saprospiraceae bacterium]